MSKQVAVEDLWPGDVVLARRPGGYLGMPCRVARIEPEASYLVRLHLERGGFEFSLRTCWNEVAELVE